LPPAAGDFLICVVKYHTNAMANNDTIIGKYISGIR